MKWNGLDLPDNPYYQDEWVIIYHGDCREILPELPKVDLVLTDPPYGLNALMQGGTWRIKFKHSDMQRWDFLVEQSLIDYVINLGKQAIVWGGNYYAMLPSRCWLAWDKLQKLDTLADFELAWTNFDKPCKSWTERRNHAEDGNKHPTQKPISLFKWCILQADNPHLILDPFMGIGTTPMASKELNRRCIGIEIEEKYCEIAANRCRQMVFDFSKVGKL